MTRCPVSAPIPSDEQLAGSPGVTTSVDVGLGGRVGGAAVCGWNTGGAVGGAVCGGAGADGCVGEGGGSVACVGNGNGAAVLGGAPVVDGAPVGGTVVVVESEVIRGIVSSNSASRESAQAPAAIANATAATPDHHQRRATIAGRAAMSPVSTRSSR